MTTPSCLVCHDTGHVCEWHMDKPWAELVDHPDACACGAGAPCPRCLPELQPDMLDDPADVSDASRAAFAAWISEYTGDRTTAGKTS